MSRVRMNWDWLTYPDSQGNGGKAIIVFSEYLGDETFFVRYSTRSHHNKFPGPRDPADQEITIKCKSHYQAFEAAKTHAKEACRG